MSMRCPEELATIADGEGAEAPRRRLVEHHRSAAADRLDVALGHRPRQTPARGIVDAVDDHRLLGASRELDADEDHLEVVGRGDARHRAHAIHVCVGEVVREVDVRRVLRGDPQVGVGAIDGDGGVLQEPAEESDLHEHQRHREGDADERDHELAAVVHEHTKRDVDHDEQPSSGFAIGS